MSEEQEDTAYQPPASAQDHAEQLQEEQEEVASWYFVR